MRTFFTYLFFAVAALCTFSVVRAANPVYPVSDLDNCRDQHECALYCSVPANTPACWAYGQSLQNTQVLGDATGSAVTSTSSLTFPIPELGNCGSASACRAYCELPANHVACSQFASSHGLSLGQRYRDLLKYAASQLGCTDLASCKTLCELPENHAKCQAFVSKFGPAEIRSRVAAAEGRLTQLEQSLGCTSPATCSQLCQNPANHDQCRSAIQGVGSPSGTLMYIRETLHANCTGDDDCRQWCQNHPDLCPAIKPLIRPTLFPRPSGEPPHTPFTPHETPTSLPPSPVPSLP